MIGLALALPAVPLVPTAAFAAAPVTCYGDYCSGQDPQTTGCGQDAVTIANFQAENGAGIVELRWSPTCKTNWARFTQYPTGVCLNCTIGWLRAEQDGTGYSQTLDLSVSGVAAGQSVWTAMIYSPDKGVAAEAMAPLTSGSKGELIVDGVLSSWDSTGYY